ncbi:MAG TPA: nuclear transport factor 2 family protein [Alloacidobacterium sp.]|nr:nuclear transport factor 2 family protein [Alloacidobacterium sp.]
MSRYAGFCKWVLLAVAFITLWPAPFYMAVGQDATSAIRQVLDDQVAAWNKGDIDAFMRGYKNSPETTFIGKTVHHGWQQVLERYRHDYATSEARGHLEFSDLTVRMLGADHAVVTGRYHLTRAAAGGGDASGVFSLVWEKSADGWKIILDHTSS